MLHPFAHFTRGFVGKGDGENLPWKGFALQYQMRDARGQDARLARARTRQHQQRPFGRHHRFALAFVQALHIGQRSFSNRRLRRHHAR